MRKLTDSALVTGLKVEARVIPALMLREIHTIHGGSSLGYLWVIIYGLFGIGIFWGVREIFGFRALYGISVAVFLIIGFAAWNIFQETIRKLTEAANGNRALLTFPQVTHLDLLVSRALIISATEILVAALMLTAAMIWGAAIGPVDWAQLLICLLLVVSAAFGLGAVLAFFCLLQPGLRKIMPMLLRALFFCSGIFYSIESLPEGLAAVLKWNPVLQLAEFGRSALAGEYPTAVVDLKYLAVFSLSSVFFGLLLERYGRRHLAAAR
jgi:ABC-type polysaccharide/polyol phosphate export systems, permease component